MATRMLDDEQMKPIRIEDVQQSPTGNLSPPKELTERSREDSPRKPENLGYSGSIGENLTQSYQVPAGALGFNSTGRYSNSINESGTHLQ